MIIYLVIIIVILLILCGLWYFIRNKNNPEILNSYLSPFQLIKPPMPPIEDSQLNNFSYPGNIDRDIMEINNNIIQHPNDQAINLTNGHPELSAWENNISNYVGREGLNASNLTNISGPFPVDVLTNGSIIPYQESNDNSIDYDEKNTYQLLKRNDPIRPIVGEINRKSFVDPYIREELENAEKKEWWGNGEY
jgi:hypothetical protein